MIVSCEECGKKYQIDPAIIKGDEAKFECKVCKHLVIVPKPIQPEKDVNEDSARAVTATAVESDAQTDLEADPLADMAVPEIGEQAPALEAKRVAETPVVDKPRFGLTGKVIVQMLIVSLLPLLIYWYINFNQTSERIREDTQRLGHQITTGLAAHVDEWLDKNVRVLQAFGKMPAMKAMDRLSQEALLKTIQSEYPWMYLVFTTDTEGLNVARSDGKPLKDYSDRQYYQDAIAKKGMAWQTLIGKTSKKPAIVIAVPIRDGEQIVGVLAAAMQIDTISNLIATWKQGRTGFAFLVDEKGKVVAHQQKAYVVEQKNLSANPLVTAVKKGQKELISFPNDGKTYIGQGVMTDYKWVLAIQQEENEAFKALKETQKFAYVLLGITVIVVLLIALLMAKSIVNPIRKLTDAADRISVGELDVEIDIRTKDEIAALGNAISRMQDSIRLSIERLRRRK